MMFIPSRRTALCQPQTGASLIMVLLILIVVSLLGVGGAQIALMNERGARNSRDQQVAFQAAEAALVDAEFDLFDTPLTNVLNRKAVFDGLNQNAFITNCGTAASGPTGQSLGLCALNSTGHQAWLDVDYLDITNSAKTTAFGTFTGRAFAAGGTGVQPARVPRYVIEMIKDPIEYPDKKQHYVYRVTAIGFGPRVDIQSVMQIVYRI